MTASSTMYTYLGYRTKSTSGGNTAAFTQLCPIKDFPDLGGAPDQVEITDLDDDVQKFVLGVQAMSALEFTANYDADMYSTLSKMANGTFYEFGVFFGKNSTDTNEYGAFIWEGQLSVWVVGGGVNGVREMRISISAASKIEQDLSATITLS